MRMLPPLSIQPSLVARESKWGFRIPEGKSKSEVAKVMQAGKPDCSRWLAGASRGALGHRDLEQTGEKVGRGPAIAISSVGEMLPVAADAGQAQCR